MRAIYELVGGRWSGRTRMIAQSDGCPKGWVRYDGEPPEEGAFWVGGGWGEGPMLDVGQQRDALIATVTEVRWEKETGGIDLPGGIRIATGLADQNRITSVVANAQLAGVATVDFKAASGWVTLTVAEVQAIAAAIALHVQTCFSVERAHHEALGLLQSIEDLQAYDIMAGWPEPGA